MKKLLIVVGFTLLAVITMIAPVLAGATGDKPI